MKWLRRIAVAPLLLLAWITAIGSARIFAHQLPDTGTSDGLFAAFVAAASSAGAYLLLRPEIQDLGGLSWQRIRRWAFSRPLGQAVLLYAAAAAVMLAAPKHPLVPGLLALFLFSALSAWTAVFARRWWTHAILAVIGFVLLLCALAATAEALVPRGFGEGSLVLLLPIEAFPVFFGVSGILSWIRSSRFPAEQTRVDPR